MEITKTELLNVLNQVSKPTFVNITMVTDVRMRKTDNPYFGLVKKVSNGNYLIGTDYESRVNNNSEKEHKDRDFVTEAPKGKRHISKCVLIDTKTESVHYLMMERFNEIKPKVNFIQGNDPIEKELFSQFMYQSYNSQKQQQDRKVMVITPKLSNIKSISIDKMKYEIIEEEILVEN